MDALNRSLLHWTMPHSRFSGLLPPARRNDNRFVASGSVVIFPSSSRILYRVDGVELLLLLPHW